MSKKTNQFHSNTPSQTPLRGSVEGVCSALIANDYYYSYSVMSKSHPTPPSFILHTPTPDSLSVPGNAIGAPGSTLPTAGTAPPLTQTGTRRSTRMASAGAVPTSGTTAGTGTAIPSQEGAVLDEDEPMQAEDESAPMVAALSREWHHFVLGLSSVKTIDDLIQLIPEDYRFIVRNCAVEYKKNADKAHVLESQLAKLNKQAAKGERPSWLNSLSAPKVQVGQDFAKSEDFKKFQARIEEIVDKAKDDTFTDTIVLRRKELLHYRDNIKVGQIASSMQSEFNARFEQIKANWHDPNSLEGRQVLAKAQLDCSQLCKFSSFMLGRILELSRSSEASTLHSELRKLELANSAKEAAATEDSEPTNRELHEAILGLTRRMDSSKKVSNWFISNLIKSFTDRNHGTTFVVLSAIWQEISRTEGRSEKGRKSWSGRQKSPSDSAASFQQASRVIAPSWQVVKEGSKARRATSTGLNWLEEEANQTVALSEDSAAAVWQEREVVRQKVIVDGLCPGVEARAPRYDSFWDLAVVLTSNINFFDYKTYPECILYLDFELAIKCLVLLAPSNLLGKLRFAKEVHMQAGTEVSDQVNLSLSCGFRFLQPPEYNMNVIEKAWTDSLGNIARSINESWAIANNTFVMVRNREVNRYGLHIPIPPYTKGSVDVDFDDNRFSEAFMEGRSVLLKSAREAPPYEQPIRMHRMPVEAALSELASKRLLVKQTDKNLGTCVVDADWYENKVQDFLEGNKRMFAAISPEYAREASLRTREYIIMLKDRHVCKGTPGLYGFLTHKCGEEDADGNLNVEVPLFYGLLKIHKKVWAIRPITPCHSVMQGPASEFLSLCLKELLPMFPQILISSKQLVIALQKLNSSVEWMYMGPSKATYRTYIFTADISGFYTNVDIKKAHGILQGLLYKRFKDDPSKDAKVKFIMDLFKIQQEDLIFAVAHKGKRQLWKQHNGLAMGVAASPDIANLYAAYYESPGTFTGNWIKKNCVFFGRYIDDIFGIIHADSLEHARSLLDANIRYPNLTVNWEVSETQAVFLDLEIWKSVGKIGMTLKHKPYRKPFNHFERLPYTSGHDVKVLKAAFKSEVYRLAVLSHSIGIYDSQLTWLKDLYYSRGYPAKVILSWIHAFKTKAWEVRLDMTDTGNYQRPSQEIWPLKSRMNPAWNDVSLPYVSDVIREYLLQHNVPPEYLANNFGRLVAALRRGCNLGDFANRHNKKLLGITKEMSILNLGTTVEDRVSPHIVSFDKTTQEMDVKDTDEYPIRQRFSLSPERRGLAPFLDRAEQGGSSSGTYKVPGLPRRWERMAAAQYSDED
jgi:hypothetical protein